MTGSSHGASLNLAWNANSETDLAGYRIYYGTSPGNYSASRQTNKVTSYTLNDLTEGTTYYIALTAFDTALNESQKSTEITGAARGPEICTDGIDNDGDGSVDCRDSDCNNQTCNDNNVCTTADICSNGSCVSATTLNCDDGNICTTDSCNPASGCTHTNNTGPCNDGLYCNGSDSCSGGICSVHTGNPCSSGPVCNNACNESADNCFTPSGTACTDDGNVCTNDICNGLGSCTHAHNTASCNDGNACTADDTCSGGICVGGSINCDDGNACTTDSCNPASGCSYTNNTAACSDGNACTTADTCSGGLCVGGPALSCDDGKICTSDSCNTQVGCVYTAIPGCCTQDSDCTDNNLCTGIERCDAVIGSCIPGSPPACDDGNSCTDDSCKPLIGCVHNNNASPCDDGLFCNGSDSCGDGGCTVHSGDPCQQLTCNEENDICEDVGIICDNADACSSYSGIWGITTSEDTFAGTARTSNKNVTHAWAPEIPRQGFYDISMWWSAHPKGCKNCPVEIVCNEETVGSLSVNQQLKGGQWNLLGTYGLEAGNTCRVMLQSEGLRKITCADAVKIVYRGESLPEAHISTIAPNPADTGEEIYFEGYGTSPSGKSIISYSWVSDRDGEIGSSDFLYASSLSEGKHQISFSVQDDEGIWSMPAHEKLYIGPVEITCDDGEDCTLSTGAWKTLKRADAFNGTSMVLNKKNGTYTWKPDLPVAGYYEVYLWWNSLLSSSSNSPVEVACGGVVLDTFAVNQKLDGGQWNLLGTYELEKGTACTVTITSVDSATTIADAVKLVLTDNLPNAHILFSH